MTTISLASPLMRIRSAFICDYQYLLKIRIFLVLRFIFTLQSPYSPVVSVLSWQIWRYFSILSRMRRTESHRRAGLRAVGPATLLSRSEPIEEAFSKMKETLRKAQDKSREALIDEMVRRSTRSHLRTRKAFSSTADIKHWSIRCDSRCRPTLC